MAPADRDGQLRLSFTSALRRRSSPLTPRVRVELVRDADPPAEPVTLRGAGDVYAFLKDEVAMWDRERFLTLILDNKHRLIGVEEVSVGSLTASIVHPREVFKAIILCNGAAFLVAHNHPSGIATPSREDIEITRRLKGRAPSCSGCDSSTTSSSAVAPSSRLWTMAIGEVVIPIGVVRCFFTWRLFSLLFRTAVSGGPSGPVPRSQAYALNASMGWAPLQDHHRDAGLVCGLRVAPFDLYLWYRPSLREERGLAADQGRKHPNDAGRRPVADPRHSA